MTCSVFYLRNKIVIENDQLFVYKDRVGFVCTCKIARYCGSFKFRVKLCHPVIVGKLTILFVDKYPDFENLKYINENFNLKFGRPHVDVCSECERHGTKLKDVNIHDNAKKVAAAELMVHKRRAKKFYNKIKEAQTSFKNLFIIGRKDLMRCAHSSCNDYIMKHISSEINELDLLSDYVQFLYESSSPGYVKTWEYIDGLHSDIIKLLKEHKEDPTLSNKGAYKDPVSINEKKIGDIKKVMRHIQGGTLEFYYHVTSWKTTNTENDD
nr:unnamed protein product [Callosobruchus analis]